MDFLIFCLCSKRVNNNQIWRVIFCELMFEISNILIINRLFVQRHHFFILSFDLLFFYIFWSHANVLKVRRLNFKYNFCLSFSSRQFLLTICFIPQKEIITNDFWIYWIDFICFTYRYTHKCFNLLLKDYLACLRPFD